MELRVDFESLQEWSAWHEQHAGSFAAWTECVADSVRSHGYVEPLTQIHVDPADIRIDRAGYRESLASNELNSRKRALLLELDLLSKGCEQFSSRDLRILLPETRSRTATVLSGFYSNVVGANYNDLGDLNIPDKAHDLVAVGDDAWEHVTSLPRAIEEIARVLRPGGALIATCRFAFHSAVSAPRAPGWDILDMCRQAGLHDARMILHGSSVHGITADDTPGVFVLSAIKVSGPGTRPRTDWLWNAKHINRLVGVLGIPRSGTTMFTAVLDAHSDVVSNYEPWNVQKSSSKSLQHAITAASLIEEAERHDPEATTLLIKETGLDPAYAENLTAILAQAMAPLSHHLLIMLRNPFHCFLSEVEGRRKWWGEAGLEVNEVLFDRWAQRTLASFSQMVKLSGRYPGAFVFYEACVSDPVSTFSKVMRVLGLEFNAGQLRISQNTDVSRIRGDLSLVENTRDVANASILKRSEELKIIAEKFQSSAMLHRIERLVGCFADFEKRGVIASEHPDRDVFLAAVSMAADGAMA